MMLSEIEYDEVVAGAVRKPEGHVQLRNDQFPEAVRLYTITTISPAPKYGGERTPVICTSFERAKEIVETNEGDIYECSYGLVVVEALVPNCLYSASYLMERYWWVRGDCPEDDYGKYYPIEEPEHFKNTYGFGIG